MQFMGSTTGIPLTYLHSFAELCFINRLKTRMLNLKIKQNVYR